MNQSKAPMHITPDSFDKAINSESVVVVDFYADWCGPCKAFAPVLDKVAKTSENCLICKFDVDQDNAGSIAMKYQIKSIPTVAIFRNKEDGSHEKVYQNSGSLTEDELNDLISKARTN